MRLIDADKIIFREIDEIGGEYEPYLGCSKSQIDSLPTVTPQEPKTGHWIKGIEEDWNGEDEFIEEYLECDKCHYRYSDGLIAYNFCPNCGAKMAETEEI